LLKKECKMFQIKSINEKKRRRKEEENQADQKWE
jgi:hypothetical protein